MDESPTTTTGRGDDADGPTVLSGFRAVSDAVSGPLLLVGGDGSLVDVNDACLAYFDVDGEAVRGRPLSELFPSLSVGDLAAHAEDGGTVTVRARVAGEGDRPVGLSVERRSSGDADWYVLAVSDTGSEDPAPDVASQYERIVETVDDGVYVLDAGFDIAWVNDAVCDLTGYETSELVGANASLLASEETLSKAATISEALVSGDTNAATITTTLVTADGEELPVETRFSVYEFADGSYGQVGVVRDISDRIRYEQTLTALNESTRDLLHTETAEEVCELVVDTATEVVDCSAAAAYLLDRDANVLRPTASARLDGVADLPAEGSGDGPLWETFVTGERHVHDGRDPSFGGGLAGVADRLVSVPLGDYGVFVVALPDGPDPDTMELVDIVATSAESGLDRVAREERLRERDREVREQNAQLRRLQGINEVIRRVHGAMVDADSRGAVESVVCTELAEADLFSFAWIGREDGGTLVPVAMAGEGSQYLDAADRSLDGDGGPPSVRTARTGEATVVPQVVSLLREGSWASAALTHDFQSVISVPVPAEAGTDGVLTVYAPRPDAVDETTRSVFTELGETIADALRVVETKQWLSADSVTELELTVHAPSCPFSRLASETGADLVYEGSVATDGATRRTFFRLQGTDADALREAAGRQAIVTGVTQLSATETDPRVEVCTTAPTLPATLTDLGSRIRSLTIGPERAVATVEVPPTGSVRALVEALEDVYTDARLDARHGRASPSRTEESFRLTVEERLTDRQWQVLRTAYLRGFFDWPRTTTGEEIADALGVSQPTINRHLRVSERKLLELLFDDD